MDKNLAVQDSIRFPLFTLYSDSLYRLIDKCVGESNNNNIGLYVMIMNNKNIVDN